VTLDEMYLRLRELALQATSEIAGGLPQDPAGKPFAVVTDIGYPKGIATVVAMIGGTASIYFSTGGGFIGGGERHEAIQMAAKHAVETAQEELNWMHATTSLTPPQPGDVAFYVLTKDGILSASATEAELLSSRAPLRSLYLAVQDVITKYRLIDPRKHHAVSE
jgi:hypothetical protein